MKMQVLMHSLPRGFLSGAFSGFPAAMHGFSFVAVRGFRIPLIAYFGRRRKVSHTNGHHKNRHNPALNRTCAKNRAGPVSSTLERSAAVALNLLAGFLFIMSAYVAWWALSSAVFVWLALAAVFLVAAAGLFRRKRWSQYLWHSIAITATVSWLVSVVRAAQSGMFNGNALDITISFAPGLLLVSLCAGGSAVVINHFRGNKNAL